jgi:IPT/TIG domain
MSTALARKFRCDVTTDLTLAGGWLQLNGIFDFKPLVSPKTIDTSAYDTNGWDSNTVISNGWAVTADCWRRTTAGVYDPGQELLRACVGQSGVGAEAGVRWYDKNGGPESFQGTALVAWSRSKTGVADGDAASVAMTGDGVLYPIANPGVAAAVPVITSALPSAIAVGGVVTITGSGFTGTVVTSGVKFGASNATSWSVVSDNVIVAVMPSGSAGAGNIVVTNAVGPSTPAFAYTRGA